MGALTDKREQFCQEYLIDLCATQAAIRAGYSAHSAREIARQLMRDDAVRARVAELKADRADRTQARQDRVIEELLAVAFADMADFLTWGPDGFTLVASAELSPELSRIVLEVTETITKVGITRSIKLHPKLRALELLAKHLGILKEDINVKHSGAVRFLPPTTPPPSEGADG